MPATYSMRPGFDHVVRLRCRLDRTREKVRGRVSFFTYTLVMAKEDDTPRLAYKYLVNDQTGPIADWLAGDHVRGRYTIKLFLDQVLVSFDDEDSAFAFKMRWG